MTSFPVFLQEEGHGNGYKMFEWNKKDNRYQRLQ
jgi:hypothetical protein